MKREKGKRSNELGLPKKIAAAIAKTKFPVSRSDLPQEYRALLDEHVSELEVEGIKELSEAYAPDAERLDEGKPPPTTLVEALVRARERDDTIVSENPTFEAAIPIVLDSNDSKAPELIGSGVLIRIGDRVFLLTAAHLTDQEANGELLIPGSKGFIPISGHFASMRPPTGSRNDDRLDIAYYRLDAECLNDLDANCLILERPDVVFEDGPTKLLSYTFTGFPWRRGATKARGIETSFHTFSGLGISRREYPKFGLDPRRHIAIRYRRRRTFHIGKQRVMMSP